MSTQRALQPEVDVQSDIERKLRGYSPCTLARELVQNADDSDSTFVEIRYIADPPFPVGSQWRRPCLLVSNDGVVTQPDWINLRRVSTSGKTGDPFKIGRFGVGKVALFAVSDVHLLQGRITRPEQPDELAGPIPIAALKDQEIWDLPDEEANGIKMLLGSANPTSRLHILVPLRMVEDPLEHTLQGIAGWDSWAETWLKRPEDAIRHWRTLAQVLPLTRRLRHLRVFGEDWEAVWSLEGQRRDERLCTPIPFQGWPDGPDGGNPLPEASAPVSFSGNILEHRPDRALEKVAYWGREIRLAHAPRIDVYKPSTRADEHPNIAHAAVLRVGLEAPKALRQVVFLGLGDMHEQQQDGLGTLILHANGYTDPTREHLVKVDPTEGANYEGVFNQRLLRDGLLPLLPHVLAGGHDPLHELTRAILRHPWVGWLGEEAVIVIEREVRLRMVRAGKSWAWACLGPHALRLPIACPNPLPDSWLMAFETLSNFDIQVVDANYKAFSEPSEQLPAWEKPWLDALEASRPTGDPTPDALKNWYDLLYACRKGSEGFDIRERPWLWVENGLGQGAWTSSSGFKGFAEGASGETSKLASLIRAACPSLPWVMQEARHACDLADCGVTPTRLLDRIDHVATWGGEPERNALLTTIHQGLPREPLTEPRKAALRRLVAGGVEAGRILGWLPDGEESPQACLQGWVGAHPAFGVFGLGLIQGLPDPFVQDLLLQKLDTSRILTYMVAEGDRLMEPPTALEGRKAWARQVLEAAGSSAHLGNKPTDWKALRCHGPEGNQPWNETWEVLTAKGPKGECLAQAALALDVTCVERPAGLVVGTQLWKTLRHWTAPRALQAAWHANSPWASLLLDVTSDPELKNDVDKDRIPVQDGGWVAVNPEAAPEAELVRKRCSRLLRKFIQGSPEWRPETDGDTTAWMGLPYHLSPEGQPVRWQPYWYRGMATDCLSEAANVLGATIFDQNPYPEDDPSHGFWVRMQEWSPGKALEGCAYDGAPTMVLAQVANLLAVLQDDIPQTRVDFLAHHTEWINADMPSSEEVRHRCARILALWAQRGYSEPLEALWVHLPCFPLPCQDGRIEPRVWDAHHYRRGGEPWAMEAASILGKVIVEALTWPNEPWCNRHHAIHDYWGRLPQWTERLALQGCLGSSDSRALAWVARWFDATENTDTIAGYNVDAILGNLEWLAQAPRPGELPAAAAFRRAGWVLGRKAQLNPTAEQRKAWCALPLHGPMGLLGPWPQNLRLADQNLDKVAIKSLHAAARACGLIVRPGVPENIPPRFHAQYLACTMDAPRWSLEQALAGVLDLEPDRFEKEGAVCIGPLLEGLRHGNMTLELKQKVMVQPWLEAKGPEGKTIRVAPFRVLHPLPEQWPAGFPAPGAPGWAREEQVAWPTQTDHWLLSHQQLDRASAAAWTEGYQICLDQILLGDPLGHALLPPGLGDGPQCLEGLKAWLIQNPLISEPSPGAQPLSWDRAWSWGHWLNQWGHLTLGRVQAPAGESLQASHWREGLARLGALMGTSDLPKGFASRVFALALALAKGWADAQGAIQSGLAFKGLSLPNALGNWTACKRLAEEAGHQAEDQKLHLEFREILQPKASDAETGAGPNLLKEEELEAYVQSLAEGAGEGAPQTCVLFGAFLAACGGALDAPANALLRATTYSASALRTIHWDRDGARSPAPVLRESGGRTRTLDGGWLDIQADRLLVDFQAGNSEHGFVLLSRNAHVPFEVLQKGVREILMHLVPTDRTLQAWFAEPDHFIPAHLDARHLTRGILEHVPGGLTLMQRFLPDGPAMAVRDFLGRLENLQHQRDEALDQDPMNQERVRHLRSQIRSEYKKFKERVETEKPFHTNLMKAARDYIKCLGYTEDRVLFELFQNADDAVAQWEALGQTQDTPGQSVFTVHLHQSTVGALTRTLSVHHEGRPIGRWRGLRNGEEQWRDDLIHMLAFHRSGKAPHSRARGFFGLGFKSVYLMTKEPFIFSGGLRVRVKGALWPKDLTEGQGASDDLVKLLEEMNLQEHQLPSPTNPFTLIALRVSGRLTQEQMDHVFYQFGKAAIPMLAFSKKLRCIKIKNLDVAQSHAWEPEVSGNAARMTAGNRTWWLWEKDGRHVLLCSDGDALLPPKGLPTLWALAPTEVYWGETALCLNGGFQLDTGRTRIPDTNAGNRTEFEALGALAAQALLEWAGVHPERSYSIWSRIGHPLAEYLRINNTDEGAQVFASRLAQLWWDHPLLPSGAGQGFVAGGQVKALLMGAEAWETCPAAFLTWLERPENVGGSVLALGTWDRLQALRRTQETIRPKVIKPSELLLPVLGGARMSLHLCCLPGSAEWSLACFTNHRLDLEALGSCGVAQVSADLIQWFRSQRDPAVHNHFRVETLKAHILAHPEDAAAQAVVDHDSDLMGPIYQALRAMNPSSQTLRTWLGLDRPPLNPPVPTPDPSPIQVPTPTETVSSWIIRVARAWEESPRRNELLGLYQCNQSREDLKSDDPQVWRAAWFKLMVFSAIHSLGRFHAATGRNFVNWLQDVGDLIQEGLGPDPFDSEPNKAWLARLYGQVERLAQGEDPERDFTFRSLFAIMHRIAYQLPAYRSHLLSHQWAEGPIRVAAVNDPNTNPLLEGTGLALVAPFSTVLGTVGFHVLLRELLVLKVIDNPNLMPHAFPPFGRLRRELKLGGYGDPASTKVSREIHEKIVEALGSDTYLHFRGAFDIPLMAALDGALPLEIS